MDKLYHLLVYIRGESECWKNVLCGPSFELAWPKAVNTRDRRKSNGNDAFVHPLPAHVYKKNNNKPSYTLLFARRHTSKSFWNSIRILAGLKMNAFCIVSFLIFIRFCYTLCVCCCCPRIVSMPVVRRAAPCSKTRYFPIYYFI